MRILYSWLAVFMVLFGCQRLHAETLTIVDAKAPAIIPLSETHKFQFGTVSQADTTVLLKIRTRMDLPTLLGSMNFLRIKMNGREVVAAKGRYAHRILNKPLASPVTSDLTVRWYDTAGWTVVYAPDFQLALTQKHYVGDPYLYVLDVTDLTNPIAENRMEITNTATLDFVQSNKLPNDKLDMVIGSMEIETKPERSKMMDTEDLPAPFINRGEPAAKPAAYRGEILPGGGIALKVGKSTYRFDSKFSFPDAGFNRLAAGPVSTAGQKDWKVIRNGNTVKAQGSDYSIVRTVEFKPNRITVSDAITNKHKDAPLGLSVRHELDMNAIKDVPVRLAGNPDPAMTEYHSYGNPSVHFTIPEGGLGMITEDEVLRHQSKLYTALDEPTGNTVGGIRTDMLRLAPGETYTTSWSIYPVAGPDYYDFVNQVRNDWGANYTVYGTWIWGWLETSKLSVEEIRARVKRQGIRYFIGPDWAEWSPNTRIAFGSDVFSDYWKKRRQENLDQLKKLRQVSPDIKILGYYNAMRDTSDDVEQRYADSMQVDEAGKPLTTLWPYTGATNASHTMVPTLKNSFGKAMVEVARRYKTDMQLDGIYWDEMEGILFGEILTTYNNFDGHSCLLDPKTWRIKREVGIVPLASLDFYNAVQRIAMEKGGTLLSNGPTGNKGTLKLRAQRMTEVQHNDYYAYEGNLQPPLGYMSWSDNWDNNLRVIQMATLPAVGFRSELPHDIAGFLFPFTPIELHRNYLLGKERIVAAQSGNFGWSNERALVQVHHFDNTGKLTKTDFATKVGAEARTSVTLNPKEAIILERLPAEFVPTKSCTGEVSAVRYGETGLALKINAPSGGLLKLKSGVFAVTDGANVPVKLGTTPAISQKATKTGLTLSLPAGFNGEVTIGAHTP
jgi:hypothetical protein